MNSAELIKNAKHIETRDEYTLEIKRNAWPSDVARVTVQRDGNAFVAIYSDFSHCPNGMWRFGTFHGAETFARRYLRGEN